MRFADRREAGEMLGDKLRKVGGDSVVYALPRGGVETGVEVARVLRAPLGLAITRKIGSPSDPEYAIGAVTETGRTIWSRDGLAQLGAWQRWWAASIERSEARRRRIQYLPAREQVSALGRAAILVDDGIATGLTMLAAVTEIEIQHPARMIVAAPVATSKAVAMLLEQVDDVVTLERPEDFRGTVSAHYLNFPQLTDARVIELLASTEIE